MTDFQCGYCQGFVKRRNPYRGSWECRGCSAPAPADFQVGPEIELQRMPTSDYFTVTYASTAVASGMMSIKSAKELLDEGAFG